MLYKVHSHDEGYVYNLPRWSNVQGNDLSKAFQQAQKVYKLTNW